MSNQTLSVVSYVSEVVGDLSTNPKYAGYAHTQSNLGLWAEKEGGIKFPIIYLKGAVKVEEGYVVLLDLNLGQLFDLYEQDDKGNMLARHAKKAIFIPEAKISAATKRSLDMFVVYCKQEMYLNASKPIAVSEEVSTEPEEETVNKPKSVATRIKEAGEELREGIIKDKNREDTGVRFPGLSFGRNKGLVICHLKEVELADAINGFNTSWTIEGFLGGGDYRFYHIGAGGGGSVTAVNATVLDVDAELGILTPTPKAAAAPAVTQVTEVPAAPRATGRSFVRA